MNPFEIIGWIVVGAITLSVAFYVFLVGFLLIHGWIQSRRWRKKNPGFEHPIKAIRRLARR